MKSRFPAFFSVPLLLCAAIALSGCGKTPLTLTRTSDNGLFTITFHAPDTPGKGRNSATITVVDKEGAPAAGLTIAITPWMPIMKHGTMVVPKVRDTGGGIYTVDYALSMNGFWQLKMALSGNGAADTAILELRDVDN